MNYDTFANREAPKPDHLRKSIACLSHLQPAQPASGNRHEPCDRRTVGHGLDCCGQNPCVTTMPHKALPRDGRREP